MTSATGTVPYDEPENAPPPEEWVDPQFPADDSDIPSEPEVEPVYVEEVE